MNVEPFHALGPFEDSIEVPGCDQVLVSGRELRLARYRVTDLFGAPDPGSQVRFVFHVDDISHGSNPQPIAARRAVSVVVNDRNHTTRLVAPDDGNAGQSLGGLPVAPGGNEGACGGSAHSQHPAVVTHCGVAIMVIEDVLHQMQRDTPLLAALACMVGHDVVSFHFRISS
ncbi:MAG: hypothetical protein KDK53_06240 [Maritimibacter sp.]|nr:hypothetical protein [Maritimibacter sp.]